MRIVIQTVVFFLALALIGVNAYTIFEYYNAINQPAFNPRDAQAGFVQVGILIGSIVSPIAAAILIAINHIAAINKEKSSKSLLIINNVALIGGALVLPLYRLFVF